MVRKRFLFLLVLMSILILPVFVSAEVLWDQPLSSVNTQAYYDQDQEYNPSDMWAADDFWNETTWYITTIFVPGNFRSAAPPNTLLNATNLHWQIYANDVSKPDGDPSGRGNPPLWSLSLAPTDPRISVEAGSGGYLSNVTLTLAEPVIFAPGKYWLVFYPEMTSANGVYGIQPSDTTWVDHVSYSPKVVQPGGADGYPTEWTSALKVAWPVDKFPIPFTQENFAFRLEGTVTVQNIVVTPGAINFGDVLIGQTSVVQTLTISNTGTADLTINTMTITGTNSSEFSMADGGTCGTTFPINLAASESCTQNVTFTPTSVGAKSASLDIASDDIDIPTVNVALSGTGLDPNISVSPAILNFGSIPVNATSPALEVTISNTGESPLNVNSIVISGTNAAMFAVTTGGTTPCATLAPIITAGENCTVNVTFTPTSAGAKSASLDVSSNDGDTPTANVPLSGTGGPAVLSVIEGTIGTEITITAAPGSSFGDKKGKVLIGDVKIKIAKDGWTPTEIKAIVNKVIPVATYPVTIQPKPYKTAPPIVLPGAFTVNKPEIDADLSDKNGAPDTEATIKGLWFGPKKGSPVNGKVYLGEKKCKVKSWTMNPTTGESTIVFVVPKNIGAATYVLEVQNKVGRSLGAFTTP